MAAQLPAPLPVSALTTHENGLLRIEAAVSAGSQRLSDYCNRLEGPLQLTGASGELLVEGEVRDRWEAPELGLQLDQIDVLTSNDRRRVGDPTLRVSLPSRSVLVVLPTVRVAGIVRVPEGASGPMLPGRSSFVALSPALLSSRHFPDARPEMVELCLVYRRRVVAVMAASDPDLPAPDRSCTRRGCELAVTGRCGYRDAGGAECAVALCDEHSHEVEGERYCDRHHEVEITLRSAAGSLHELRRPPVGDRTLSLVQLLHRDLDAHVLALLAPQSAGLPDAHVSSDAHVRAQVLEGTLCWERGWGVNLPQGYLARVLLRIPLGEPPMVKVLVNRAEVFAGVPEWIRQRLSGTSVDPDGRDRFVRQLERLIAGALAPE